MYMTAAVGVQYGGILTLTRLLIKWGYNSENYVGSDEWLGGRSMYLMLSEFICKIYNITLSIANLRVG